MNNDDLQDLYAGLAMQGLLMNGDYSLNTIPHLAHELAASMIREKEFRDERNKDRP